MANKLIILYLTLIAFCFPGKSQPLNDSIYVNNIHTVQSYKEGNELNFPVIKLNSQENLIFSFDDLDSKAQNYYYKIIHCNTKWEPENISYTDYLDGFESNIIENRRLSTNTMITFHHYSLKIPNESNQLKISGNYILMVFLDNDESKIVFTKKFYVAETNALIDFQTMRPQLPAYMQRFQQFKLKVQPLIDDIADIKEEIHVIVMQNFNPLKTKKPSITFIDNGMLIFDDIDSCLFPGGNEFRNFDIKSTKYQSPRIQSMGYVLDTFQVNLLEDQLRTRKLYYSDADLNGRYYIENSRGYDKNKDADYIKVSFKLPSNFLAEGDIHLFGELTGWNLNNDSKMNYNFNSNAYEKTVLLKQGYYNYYYVLRNKEFSVIDDSFTEGNHFETENEYQVFVYYKSSSLRYDRLIGFFATTNPNLEIK